MTGAVEAKWFLAPDLWSWAEAQGVQADIDVQHEVGGLIVSAWLPEREPKAFAITRQSIEDGRYVREFRANLDALKENL